MHSDMGQVRQNPIQRTVRTIHLSVLMTVHGFNTQCNTEQFCLLYLSCMQCEECENILTKAVKLTILAGLIDHVLTVPCKDGCTEIIS